MDNYLFRIHRKQQLFRGWLAQIQGVHAGQRFGLGPHVHIEYPSSLEVGDDVTIEEMSYLHCLAEHGVKIGARSSIDRNCWLSCGCHVGEALHGFFSMGTHSYIGCNAVIGAGGGIKIGNHVSVGQSVNFHSEEHIFSDPMKRIDEQGVIFSEIVIEDDVWIGSKATLLSGVTIGTGTIIGAGAVVRESLPAYSVAVGVPAKIIRMRK